MSNPSNQPNPFLSICQSLQAREVLVALEKHGPGNDQLYYHWLGTIGLGPSHRDLSELLDRLEREGFVATEQVENHRVIKATRAGIEVAQARVGVDWIARIEPQ